MECELIDKFSTCTIFKEINNSNHKEYMKANWTMRFEKDSDHVKSIHYFNKKSTEIMTEIETEKPHKTFAEKIAPIPSLESDEERIK